MKAETMKPRSAIYRLPIDLLFLINDNLSDEADRQSLRHVCKSFRLYLPPPPSHRYRVASSRRICWIPLRSSYTYKSRWNDEPAQKDFLVRLLSDLPVSKRRNLFVCWVCWRVMEKSKHFGLEVSAYDPERAGCLIKRFGCYGCLKDLDQTAAYKKVREYIPDLKGKGGKGLSYRRAEGLWDN